MRASPWTFFLESVKGLLGERTIQRLKRNLRTIMRYLQTLRDQGKVSATNPAKLKERDIAALLYHWQTRPSRYGRPLDLDTQRKYLSDLDGLLESCGNGSISAMRRKRVRLPKSIPKPIEVLSPEDGERLRRAAESIEGWEGSVARLLVGLLPGSGLRRKELRLARIQDLDMKRWRIRVCHPKGEGAWAAEDYAPIATQEARQAIADFLAEREVFLGGQRCEALIPYRYRKVPRAGTLDYWPDAMLGKLKADLERTSSVAFHLKTFRATFAQVAKDGGARIEAVSRALRHRNTKTTEQYYARIRPDDAFEEVEQAFLVQKPIRKDGF